MKILLTAFLFCGCLVETINLRKPEPKHIVITMPALCFRIDTVSLTIDSVYIKNEK